MNVVFLNNLLMASCAGISPKSLRTKVALHACGVCFSLAMTFALHYGSASQDFVGDAPHRCWWRTRLQEKVELGLGITSLAFCVGLIALKLIRSRKHSAQSVIKDDDADVKQPLLDPSVDFVGHDIGHAVPLAKGLPEVEQPTPKAYQAALSAHSSAPATLHHTLSAPARTHIRVDSISSVADSASRPAQSVVRINLRKQTADELHEVAHTFRERQFEFRSKSLSVSTGGRTPTSNGPGQLFTYPIPEIGLAEMPTEEEAHDQGHEGGMSKTEVANVAFMALLFIREVCFVFLLWSIDDSNRGSGGGQIVLLLSSVSVSGWGLTTALLYQHGALAGISSDLAYVLGSALHYFMMALGSCTALTHSAHRLPIDTNGPMEEQERPERNPELSQRRRSSVETILRASLGDGGRPWVTSTRYMHARSLGSVPDDEGLQYYRSGYAVTRSPSVTGTNPSPAQLDNEFETAEAHPMPLSPSQDDCTDLATPAEQGGHGFSHATAATMSI
jgi:hypothetical protein